MKIWVSYVAKQIIEVEFPNCFVILTTSFA
jgi:hypothetical protein